MKNRYFRKYLKIAPFALALWRAVEAEAIESACQSMQQKTKLKKTKTSVFKKPLLDLGCGFGEFAGVFFESQIEVGIDISMEDLIRAKGANKYKKLIACDARKLPFPSNKFATALSVSVLEHIPRTQEAIKEAYRVLKPGGFFIYTVPTTIINKHLFFPRLFKSIGIKRFSSWYIRNFHKAFKHETLVSPRKWLAMTRAAGFQEISVTGTASKSTVQVFDLTLVFAVPSQILRQFFGTRMIWGLSLKAPILEKLYEWVKRDNKTTESNILVIAKK